MNTFKITALGFAVIALSGCGNNQLVSVNSGMPAATSTAAVSTSTEASAKPVLDNRPETTTDELNKDGKILSCNNLPELNFDEPNTTIPFKDEAFGIEVALPYNEAWGSKTFKLQPAERDLNGIAFGRVNIFGEGGCAYMRHFHLNVRPKRTIEQLKQDLLNEQAISEHDVDTTFHPILQTFKGKKVIAYNLQGLCGNDYYEVIGEKYNYEIAGWCNEESLESTSEIYKIIESLKFI